MKKPRHLRPGQGLRRGGAGNERSTAQNGMSPLSFCGRPLRGLDQDLPIQAGKRARRHALRLDGAERAVRVLRTLGAAPPVRAAGGRLQSLRAKAAERAATSAMDGLVRHGVQSSQIEHWPFSHFTVAGVPSVFVTATVPDFFDAIMSSTPVMPSPMRPSVVLLAAVAPLIASL